MNRVHAQSPNVSSGRATGNSSEIKGPGAEGRGEGGEKGATRRTSPSAPKNDLWSTSASSSSSAAEAEAVVAAVAQASAVALAKRVEECDVNEAAAADVSLTGRRPIESGRCCCRCDGLGRDRHLNTTVTIAASSSVTDCCSCCYGCAICCFTIDQVCKGR